MMKSIQELGPCGKIVRSTMLECFFVMETGVRGATGEGSAGLTDAAAAEIGSKAGKCYEGGLKKLGVCMKE